MIFEIKALHFIARYAVLAMGLKIGLYIMWNVYLLKKTATLMISMFYQKELYEPWVLIQVSSKSVKKWGSYGHLKN